MRPGRSLKQANPATPPSIRTRAPASAPLMHRAALPGRARLSFAVRRRPRHQTYLARTRELIVRMWNDRFARRASRFPGFMRTSSSPTTMIQTTRRRWIAGTPGASIASEEVTPSLQGQLSTAYAPCRVGVPHITHDRPIDASGCEAILRCNQDARQFPPEAVVAMQAVSGTLHLALHTLRRNRENRNPDDDARGFHNLNLEQWEALSEDERPTRGASSSITRIWSPGSRWPAS